MKTQASGVVNFWFYKGGGERLGWWTSEVVNVWGGERLGWWTSDFTQGVVNVWGGERLGWWTSDFTLGVVNVWGGERLILHWGWWTSGVVNVWVVNVLQSFEYDSYCEKAVWNFFTSFYQLHFSLSLLPAPVSKLLIICKSLTLLFCSSWWTNMIYCVTLSTIYIPILRSKSF